MNVQKPEFIRRITKALKDNKMRKNVSVPKQVLKISDEEGHVREFAVKRANKTAIYTYDDVEAILDAAMSVIEDALTHGEDISVHGFASLGLKYRVARRTKVPQTEDWVEIKGHYIPKFFPGARLRMCAKVYDQIRAERVDNVSSAIYDDSDFDEMEDGEE